MLPISEEKRPNVFLWLCINFRNYLLTAWNLRIDYHTYMHHLWFDIFYRMYRSHPLRMAFSKKDFFIFYISVFYSRLVRLTKQQT